MLVNQLEQHTNNMTDSTNMTNSTTSTVNTTARPPSAYNLFVQDPENRKAHAGEDAKTIMKNLAADWKELDDSKRQEWEAKAAEAKKAWIANGGAPPKKEKKEKKKKKKGGGRAPSAYNLFVKDAENRKAHAGEDAKTTMKNLAVAWKELDESERQKWEAKAAEAKKAWDAEHPTESKPTASKRPPSAYNLFVKDAENRKAHAGEDAKTTMKNLAVAWTELDESERQKWEAKAAEAKKEWDAANPKPPPVKKATTKKKPTTSSTGEKKMTAYQVFMNSPEQIDSYKRNNTGKTHDEVRIIMGKAWLAFSESEKSTWEAQATA